MKIDFEKMNGLVPAIIQDATTRKVLMLGFMNEEAYRTTIETRHFTFWSRTRQTLWTKGETSGNYLNLVDMKIDCDNDTLLVQAIPDGPTCHTGTDTCWGEDNDANPVLFLTELQDFINKRHEEMPEGGGEPVFACQVAQDFYFHPIEKIPPKQQCIVAAADLPAGQKVKWRVSMVVR